MPPDAVWPPPSERGAELLRAAAERLLQQPGALFEEVDQAVFGTAEPGLVDDPALVAAVRAANRANLLHWATSNVRDPGARVVPNIGRDAVGLARDLVRRGYDNTSLNAYRAGQNIALRYWMEMAFELTSDPDELHELLDVGTRSIFAFVDETLEGIYLQVAAERDQLTTGTHAERLEAVTLILEGAPITSERASSRLRYELRRRHTAAIVWSDATEPDQGLLERAAETLARAAGAGRPFTVTASSASLWAWLAADGDLDLEAARAAMARLGAVRVAIGTTAEGIEGFRASHLDAVATQRLMHRAPTGLRVASYEDVRLVVLVAADDERATEFVARTLGELATADADLRETLRVYIREEFSASRAARALYTHRNTVLNRLNRAQELLPRPLDDRGLQVGLALEIVHWLGAPSGA